MSQFSVNTNVSSLIAQNILGNTLGAQASSFQRLATGLSVNRGSDGPAALIASEQLRAQLRVLEAESRSLQRTNSVISVADASLGEVSDLLVEAEALAVASANSAGLSEGELEANQAQLDSILRTVDRVAVSSSFNGQQLFTGDVDLDVGGGDSITIVDARTSALGETEIDGQTFTLADAASGGDLNLITGDPGSAQAVIRAARTQVDIHRGELGAAARFSLEPRLRGTAVAIANTAAANSLIRDTDFARETANLSRLQVLAESAFLVNGLAGTAPQRVLNLLTPVARF